MVDLASLWEAVVVGEAAVSYAYSVAGPRVPDDQWATAASLYDEHERARDAALLALTATGSKAIAIPTFFELPGPIDTPERARGLLATVESRLAVTYADLIAGLPMDQRQVGLDGVLLATKRALLWGAQSGPWGAEAAQYS